MGYSGPRGQSWTGAEGLSAQVFRASLRVYGGGGGRLICFQVFESPGPRTY